MNFRCLQGSQKADFCHSFEVNADLTAEQSVTVAAWHHWSTRSRDLHEKIPTPIAGWMVYMEYHP